MTLRERLRFSLFAAALGMSMTFAAHCGHDAQNRRITEENARDQQRLVSARP